MSHDRVGPKEAYRRAECTIGLKQTERRQRQQMNKTMLQLLEETCSKV
jgi:hypothetical protein